MAELPIGQSGPGIKHLSFSSLVLEEVPLVNPPSESVSEDVDEFVPYQLPVLPEDQPEKEVSESLQRVLIPTSNDEQPKPATTTSNMLQSVWNCIKDSMSFVKKVADVFTPFLNFVDNLTNVTSGAGEGDKKTTVSLLGSIFGDISSKIGSDKELKDGFSKESQDAIKSILQGLGQIQKQQNIGDSELRALISRWRDDRDHRALFEMAERIRRGETVEMDENLRRVFIESLEHLARDLEALGNKPDGDTKTKVQGLLTQTGDNLVNGVERVNERGGSANLNPEDRQYIRGQITQAAEHIQTIRQDEELYNFIKDIDDLKWVDEIIEDLRKWFDELERQEEVEQERRDKEKKCEERKELVRKAEQLHKEHIDERRKADYFKMWIQNLKRKIFFAKQELESVKNVKHEDSEKVTQARRKIQKHLNDHDLDNLAVKKHEDNEELYEGREEAILTSAPDCECDEISFNNEGSDYVNYGNNDFDHCDEGNNGGFFDRTC